MRELQFHRMQQGMVLGMLKTQIGFSIAIQLIADDRMAQMGRSKANLMCSASRDTKFDQC